jgi:8-oxo-dGTP pyrophosphatase MutT (NUDIX family)
MTRAGRIALVTDGIRQAASIILGRDAERGLEVLVVERSASSRFLPGYVAFPGGSIDAEDASVAERWFGDLSEAGRAGVVRELVEECGLAVTGSGVLESSALEPIEADPPGVRQLPEIAHWIAPEDVPVRFDARYYAAEANLPAEPTPDLTETAAAWWASPAALLRAWEQRDRLLYWPTYFTMRALSECEKAGDLLSLWIDTREPDDHELEWLHRSTFFQD